MRTLSISALLLVACGSRGQQQATPAAASTDAAPAPLDAAPEPPDAAVAAADTLPIDVRLEGERLLLGGQPIEIAGLSRARVELVPLRSDLGEWGVAVIGESGALTLLDAGGQRLFGAALSSPGGVAGAISTTVTLVDLDGDGRLDLVSSSVRHGDVGREPVGKTLYRRDAASGAFVADDELRYRPGKGHPEPKLPDLAKGERAQLRASAGVAILLHDGAPYSLGRGGGLGVSGFATAGLYFLDGKEADTAAVALWQEGKLLGWRRLGPVVLEAEPRCARNREGMSVRLLQRPGAAAIEVTWRPDASSRVGTTLAWDGRSLGDPAAPTPVPVCDAPPP